MHNIPRHELHLHKHHKKKGEKEKEGEGHHFTLRNYFLSCNVVAEEETDKDPHQKIEEHLAKLETTRDGLTSAEAEVNLLSNFPRPKTA